MSSRRGGSRRPRAGPCLQSVHCAGSQGPLGAPGHRARFLILDAQVQAEVFAVAAHGISRIDRPPVPGRQGLSRRFQIFLQQLASFDLVVVRAVQGDSQELRSFFLDIDNNFGLTELFFETSEPLNEEVPIIAVIARLPEGTYTFTGILAEDGEESVFETILTHDIPVGPTLTSPLDGEEDVDPEETMVSWELVTTDLDGDPITIVGYQVIVEEDDDSVFPSGFAQPVFSVYLPATATSVLVPPEFMRPDTEYEFEVLAIEESGNQTLSSAEFETAEE